MGPTGEGRVDDDAEAQAELRGRDLPDDAVGRVVEQGGSDGVVGLESLELVAHVVFVDEREFEGGG